MKNEENKMNFAVVPQEFLTEIKQEIDELKNLLRQKTEDERKSELIESTKIPILLNISRKTWQTYRDRRMLPFSQIGSKIYIQRSYLEDFILNHKIDAIDNSETNGKMKG